MNNGIVLIGAGNLATNLGYAFMQNGLPLRAVYSRTKTSASLLGNRLNVPATDRLEELPEDADLYVYAVKDDALESLATRMHAPQALHVHTAGSISLQVFGDKPRCGVLYPLQTFSRDRHVAFHNIPVFVEGNTPEATQCLRAVAEEISTRVYEADSVQRARLHLAAVFACNFANRMYAIADDLIRGAGLPFDVLLPLIDETAAKVHELAPAEAQTGPAVRYDRKVMDRHKAMLSDEDIRFLYEMVSENIHRAAQNKQ